MKPESAPARLVGPLGTRRAVIVTGACFAVFATVFFATSAPFAIPHVEEACGAAPLDMRFYSTATDVDQFLDACGRDGRAAYRNLQIADLVYPTVAGLFMTSALALTIKHLVPGRPGIVGWAGLALVGSGFDYLENAFAWRALASYPDVGISGTLLGFASTAKTISSWVVGVALIVGLLLLAGRSVRSRLARPRRPGMAPTLS